jgi:hypothetical protein
LERPTDNLEQNGTLPSNLNPLLNPVLSRNMGRWAEVYFTTPPEKREEAILDLLRKLSAEQPDAGDLPAVAETEAVQPRDLSAPMRVFDSSQAEPGQSDPSQFDRSHLGMHQALNSGFDQAGSNHAGSNQSPNRSSNQNSNERSNVQEQRPLVACESCGAQNLAEQRFCGMCGRSLRDVAVEPLRIDRFAEVAPASPSAPQAETPAAEIKVALPAEAPVSVAPERAWPAFAPAPSLATAAASRNHEISTIDAAGINSPDRDSLGHDSPSDETLPAPEAHIEMPLSESRPTEMSAVQSSPTQAGIWRPLEEGNLAKHNFAKHVFAEHVFAKQDSAVQTWAKHDLAQQSLGDGDFAKPTPSVASEAPSIPPAVDPPDAVQFSLGNEHLQKLRAATDRESPRLLPQKDFAPFSFSSRRFGLPAYIGAVLLLLSGILVYIAWRGTEAWSTTSHASAPAATTTQPSQPLPQTAIAPTTLPVSPQPVSKTPPANASTPSAAVTPRKTAAPVQNSPARDGASVAHPLQSAALLEHAPDTNSSSVPVAGLGNGIGNGSEELTTAKNYLNGVPSGVRDSNQAAQWLWKAVGKKNIEASLLLSDLYLRGDGVAQNCDQARLLLDAAARKHSASAAERLRNLQAFGCQ